MKMRNGRQAGQALAELSIVAVLLVSLLFGIVDGGRLIYAYHMVSFAARQGVRWAIVRGAASGRVASASDVSSYVQGVIQSMSMGVPADVAVSWSPDNQPGSAVVVTVGSSFSPITPFVPGGMRVTSSSRMIISR